MHGRCKTSTHGQRPQLNHGGVNGRRLQHGNAGVRQNRDSTRFWFSGFTHRHTLVGTCVVYDYSAAGRRSPPTRVVRTCAARHAHPRSTFMHAGWRAHAPARARTRIFAAERRERPSRTGRNHRPRQRRSQLSPPPAGRQCSQRSRQRWAWCPSS